MGFIKELWREFVAAFQAGRQGGEVDRQYLEDQEMQKLAAAWGNAKTLAEREAAGTEAIKFALRSPPREEK